MMPFDCCADDNPVPPKSRRPLEARESLPQSFHSLAPSEPDPITLFAPYNFICPPPEQRACQQARKVCEAGLLRRVSPTKAAQIFFAANSFEFNRPAASAIALVPNQYSSTRL